MGVALSRGQLAALLVALLHPLAARLLDARLVVGVGVGALRSGHGVQEAALVAVEAPACVHVELANRRMARGG
eukprot:5373038-Pyramimonas_sp.AAC.1